MQHARARPELHLVGGKVVVSGGAPPEVYEDARWAPWSGPLPRPAPHFGGLGGFEELSSWGRDHEIRSLSTGGLVCARHQHAATRLADGTVFVAGGMHHEEPTARVELGIPPGVSVTAPHLRAGLDAWYGASVRSYEAGIAIEATPNHWNNRGNSLLKLRRYADALASFDRAGSHWSQVRDPVVRGPSTRSAP